MYAVSLSGLVDAKFWRRNLRYAIVGIVIFGAVITPDGSGVTMWFVSLPMIALYFVGMIIAERQERQTLKT
jgi:sec-independent protein translocase protein TatC